MSSMQKPAKATSEDFRCEFRLVHTGVVDDGVSDSSEKEDALGLGGLTLPLLRGCNGRRWRCLNSFKVGVADAPKT
jgi:hypothetical protein